MKKQIITLIVISCLINSLMVANKNKPHIPKDFIKSVQFGHLDISFKHYEKMLKNNPEIKLDFTNPATGNNLYHSTSLTTNKNLFKILSAQKIPGRNHRNNDLHTPDDLAAKKVAETLHAISNLSTGSQNKKEINLKLEKQIEFQDMLANSSKRLALSKPSTGLQECLVNKKDSENK